MKPANDLFYDDDDSDTTDDPTISGVELASVTISIQVQQLQLTSPLLVLLLPGLEGGLDALGAAEVAQNIAGIKVGQTVKLGKTQSYRCFVCA